MINRLEALHHEPVFFSLLCSMYLLRPVTTNPVKRIHLMANTPFDLPVDNAGR